MEINLLQGEILLGKGVRYILKFVIFVFVICLKLDNGKDTEKIQYVRNCLVISVNLLYACSL